MNRTTVQDKRDAYRSAEDELTKASHLHLWKFCYLNKPPLTK